MNKLLKIALLASLSVSTYVNAAGQYQPSDNELKMIKILVADDLAVYFQRGDSGYLDTNYSFMTADKVGADYNIKDLSGKKVVVSGKVEALVNEPHLSYDLILEAKDRPLMPLTFLTNEKKALANLTVGQMVTFVCVNEENDSNDINLTQCHSTEAEKGIIVDKIVAEVAELTQGNYAKASDYTKIIALNLKGVALAVNDFKACDQIDLDCFLKQTESVDALKGEKKIIFDAYSKDFAIGQ